MVRPISSPDGPFGRPFEPLVWPHLKLSICPSVHPVVRIYTVSWRSQRLRYLKCNCANNYLRQGERSEHWRRLRNWSYCPSVCVCVYTMTHYHLHVSYTTGKNGGALLWKLLHFTVVMFKSLHLAEICTLTSAIVSLRFLLLKASTLEIYSYENVPNLRVKHHSF